MMSTNESMARLVEICTIGDKLTKDAEGIVDAVAKLTDLDLDAVEAAAAAVATEGTRALMSRLLGDDLKPASEEIVRATFASGLIMGWIGARLADGDRIGETL